MDLLPLLLLTRPDHGVKVGNSTAPGLRVRETQTGVELQSGQTLLMSGVADCREERREYGVPIVNKIPYLNRMFKNVGASREETEFVVVVQPEIVDAAAVARPAAAGSEATRVPEAGRVRR